MTFNYRKFIPALILIPASIFVAFSPATIANANDNKTPKHKPLVLADQGTFYVGGTIEFRSPSSSANPADPRALPGNIAVNQMYVEYQVPAKKTHPYPIVFMHGGGHTGQFYRTTPDGREGWFTSFTRRGFAVYVVDGANRGRSGWDPTKRIQASSTPPLAPPSAMEPVNIYSEQSAWTAFRWGPTYGKAYPNAQFPLAYKDVYLRQIQPAYRDPAQNVHLAADIGALVDKIGPCILVGWSTGTGNVLVGATSSFSRIKTVKGIVGLEGFPPAAGNAPDEAKAAKIPFLGLLGDHLSPTDGQAYTTQLAKLGGDAQTVFLPDIGLHGNGHTMALEKNNEKIADVVESWIERHVERHYPRPH